MTEESSVTAADGKNYLTKFYSILAVDYRVRLQFTRFRGTNLD